MFTDILLDRPRLLEAAAGARVCVLRAEAGAGKTMLATQLVRSVPDASDPTTIWIAIDPACTTSASFWHRAVTSAAAVLHERRSVLLSYLTGDVALADLPALIVTKSQRSGGRFRVVIDDMHLLDEETQEQISWVLERCPMISAVITTRAPIRLERADVAARLCTRTLGAEHLPFDADELAAVARLVCPARTLSPTESAAILEYTRGNPLASRIALAATARLAPASDATAVRTALQHTVRNGRAMDPLFPTFADESERAAAIRLAIVPEVDDALARALTGRSDATDLLHRFQLEGIGRMRLRERAVFAFHPIVAELLATEAHQALPPEELQRLRRTAVTQLRAWGDPVEVMRLMLAAQDDADLWPFFARHFSELSATRLTEVAALFDGLEPPIEQRDGTLALIHAIAEWEHGYGPSLRSGQLAALAAGDLLSRPMPSRPGDRLLHHLALMALRRTSGQAGAAAQHARRLLATAGSMPTSERRSLGTAFEVGVVQALVVEATLAHDDAVLEGTRLIHDDPHERRRHHLLSLTAMALARQGDMPATRTAIARLEDVEHPEWLLSIRAAGVRAATIVDLVERARPDEATSYYQATRHADTAEFWPVVLWARALALLAGADPGTAFDEITHEIDAWAAAPTGPALRGDLAAVQADLAIAAGELATAARLLDRAPQTTAVALSGARVALARQQPDAASDLVRAIATTGGLTPRRNAERLLISAVAGHRLGRQGAAAVARRAARILRAHELRTPLLFVSAEERPVLLPALNAEALLPSATDPFPVPVSRSILTPREMTVWRALCGDESLDQIAAKLFVSVNTVKSQTTSIYRKLGASTRAEAVSAGHDLGLDEHGAAPI